MSESRVKVQIDKNEFVWEKDQGTFKYDGASSLLFWDSAMEIMLQTIEEVSGSNVSKTVLEATGFRMGKLVSEYYKDRIDVDNILEEYSNIYRNAGWGIITFSSYSFENKRAIVRSRNSWENRILSFSDRTKTGAILPSQWAGLFSGLFKENMWYQINKSQLNGDEFDEIEVFPSSITPSKNIHNITRQKEHQYIDELEEMVQLRTQELSTLVNELSSPVIPVLEDILIMPLIGKFNEERFSNVIEKALDEFSTRGAEYLLIDLTGINEFDDFTVQSINHLIESIKLLGGECIVVGISPKLGTKMVALRVEINDVNCYSSLRQGILFALKQSGYHIVKKD
ncbi:STAS domain-containing protein [Oceanobacillus salinisoli]|uniref:STAS domain-containing protein n=1 Tax=Oceanobacillus salinisoli TaxID=2678611 RepID=UPI0012E10B2B|nr:STAS domain-containing protein [Oceanobacillus salinisoli]